MRVLVIGSGGREHAICWKLSQSTKVERVFCAPGNPGMTDAAEIIAIEALDFEEILDFCKSETVDLVVVGPEKPLIAGIADCLAHDGISVFGPSAYCAQIEGSKAFAKEMMEWEGVPTAEFATFNEIEPCEKHIREQFHAGKKVVVKASGEALGKGVVVCETEEEAILAAEQMLVEGIFGDAGKTVVVEERLEGKEISLIAVCCGEQYRIFPAGQDYKRAFDNDEGPNTGGMGVVSPPPWIDEANLDDLGNSFIRPILRRFSSEGRDYVGALFAGLMMTTEGPKALEYNCRFGDPETQAILERVENDLFDVMMTAARHERMPEIEIANKISYCLVVAANGYPGEYAKGVEIPIGENHAVKRYYAGVKESGGKLVSNGGRVLNLVCSGANARSAIYSDAQLFNGENWHYRSDIGA